MSRLNLPSDETRSIRPPDELLGDFFRSALPQAWPAVPLPDAAGVDLAHHRQTHATLVKSRLTVAASVALLAAASFWIAGSFQRQEYVGRRADPATWEAQRRQLHGSVSRPSGPSYPALPSRRTRTLWPSAFRASRTRSGTPASTAMTSGSMKLRRGAAIA